MSNAALVRTALRTVVTTALVLATAAAAQTRPALTDGFDDRGLASLRYGDADLLHVGPMAMTRIDLRHGFAPAATQPSTPSKSAFDPAAKRLTQTYAWGSLDCVYHVDGDRLGMDIELHNTGRDSVFGFTARPITLKLKGPVQTAGWAHGWPSPSVLNDAAQVLAVAAKDVSVAVCNEQVDRPLMINLVKTGVADEYAVEIRFDGPPLGSDINGGDWRRFSLSLRFGPAGTPLPTVATTLAGDLYQRFAERYPSELKWNDRRPIGCNFLSSIESRSPTNPTGWLHDASIDMGTDAGRADWKKRMLERFDKSASVAKEMGCQGVIVWDIEGQRNPHNVSYIGDPRLLRTLSPEMDAIADECFKKYTDAGLRCGVTLRPTHVVRTYGGKNDWEHVNVEDIAAEIAGKIAYAKQRWGCTLFYVDSTIRWDADAEGHLGLHTLPAEIFQTLHRQFPDVLLIPEQSSTRHHAYTAPYHEIMPPHNYTITPATVRAAYPNAFSVLRVSDASLIEKDFDALVAAVKSGDILMFRTWLDDPDNVPVRKILAAARQKETPVPPAP